MNKNKIILVSIMLVLIILVVFYFFKNNIKKEDKIPIKSNHDVIEQNSILSNGNINNNKINNNGLKNNMKEDCEEKYNNLLDVNKFDFDKHCTNIEIRDGKYIEKEISKKKMNLVLILDASGSMKAKVDEQMKIDIAKKAAKDFIDKVKDEENLKLSVIVYGHKGGNKESDKKQSCDSIEEIYPLSKVNSKKIKEEIDLFNATGWTPIDKALIKAKNILNNEKDVENFILLLSDGKETCDGDPVKTIKEISNNDNLKIKVDVIGFDVDNEDEKQLLLIAKAGNGEYVSAKNALDLRNAFEERREKIDELKYRINRTVEQIYDMSFIILNYNECRAALEKERAIMKLDINSSFLVSKDAKCINLLNNKYDLRYNEINNKIRNIYKKDKEKFNNIIK